MKKIKIYINCSILLFSITIAAQNGLGRNNSSNNEFQNEKSKEDFEKEKGKLIEKSIAKLKTDLQLDELQTIAIKQIVLEGIRQEGIILKKEENEDEKVKALQALSETTDTKIMALLNKVQKEKYIELKETKKKKKK